MPRDSNGNTQPLPGTIVQTGDTILPSQHNPALTDLYAMMTQSLSRDGQGGMRSNLAMNGFQLTGLGTATMPDNPVSLAQFRNGTPLGAVIDFVGVNAPPTWMFTFGQAIEVSAYPEFVAAAYVGNALNATAGFGYRTTSQTDPSNNRSISGQFIVLPDFRGRVGAGREEMGGTGSGRITVGGSGIDGALLGASGGNQVHTLSVPQIPSHGHGVNDPGHNHIASIGRIVPQSGIAGGNTFAFNDNPTSVNTTGITITPSGGDLPHQNTQPTLIINKIIKVSY